jgi:hypothetical protein
MTWVQALGPCFQVVCAWRSIVVSDLGGIDCVLVLLAVSPSRPYFHPLHFSLMDRIQPECLVAKCLLQ